MDSNNCRFLLKLNRHCQLKILEHLNNNDLLQVSKVGEEFKELSEYIVGKRLLYVNVTQKSEILAAFGKSTRRLRCIGYNCGSILREIFDNCIPNQIKEIQIEIVDFRKTNNARRPFDFGITIAELELFSNLEELSIKHSLNLSEEIDRDTDGELNKIVRSALNLKVLKLRANAVKCSWFRNRIDCMKQLCEIWIHTSCVFDIDDLKHFIRQHPKLQVFSFTGRTIPRLNATSIIGNCLAEHCKDLKVFIFTYSKNTDASNASITPPYNFLTSLPNLNVVSSASSSLAKHPLMPFISQRGIKKLEFNFNFSDHSAHELWLLKYSVDSKRLEISREDYSRSIKTDFEWLLENNTDLVSHLANLEEITIRSSSDVFNLPKLLELAPNIRMLSISQANFLHLPVAIRKIVRSFETKYQHSKCDLIVSEAQFREFEVHNRSNVVSVSIDRRHKDCYLLFH